MRFIRRTLPLLLLAAIPAAAADLAISRVYTGWRDGATFKRISEYFTGTEPPGRETILRTHPEQRTGYYFLVRLKNPGDALNGRFKLTLIEQGAPAPRTVFFPAGIGAGSKVFQLGLTGPEWQDPQAQPVAWHVEVLAADGRVIASEKSYLWEKPPGR